MISTRRPARTCIASLMCLTLAAAAWAGGPDFGSVNWSPLGCDRPDMVSASSPAAASFAGDSANPPALLRLRRRLPLFPVPDGCQSLERRRVCPVFVDGARAGGVGQSIPVPVPALAERQERHHRDLAEHGGLRRVLLSALPRQRRGRALLCPLHHGLARAIVPAATSFNGQPDWFVDFAFPVSTLVAKGVIVSAGDLSRALSSPRPRPTPTTTTRAI